MEIKISLDKRGLEQLQVQADILGISKGELASKIVTKHIDESSNNTSGKVNALNNFLHICKVNPFISSKHEEKDIWCPLDGKKLLKIKLEDVLIDYCPDCFGIWFDHGELEALLQQDIHKIGSPGTTNQSSVDDSQHKKCPFCGEDLYKREHTDNKINLDVCKFCGGIWLDGGEFTMIYQDIQKKHLKGILAEVLRTYV